MNRPAALALACLTALGCGGVAFDAETRVFPDGRIERRTQISGDLAEQELLPGGERSERVTSTASEADTSEQREDVYALTRRIAGDESVAPDFLRQTDDGAAHNRISLEVRRYGIASVYEYAEVFERENWEALAQRFEAMTREIDEPIQRGLAELLASHWPGRSRSAIAAALRAHGGPLAWWVAEARAGREVTEKGFVASFCDDPLHGFAAAERGVCRKAWTIALADDGALERLDLPDLSPWLDLGAGPFDPFSASRYRSTVELPGQVLSSNAQQRSGDTLVWEFDPRGQFHVEMRARAILWLPFLRGSE